MVNIFGIRYLELFLEEEHLNACNKCEETSYLKCLVDCKFENMYFVSIVLRVVLDIDIVDGDGHGCILLNV